MSTYSDRDADARQSRPGQAQPARDRNEPPFAELHRQMGNRAVAQLLGSGDVPEDQERSPVLDVIGQGGGTPLDSGTRQTMEKGLGSDFSDVRVHTDGKAGHSATAVGASAYTVGHEVVFAPGQFQPATPQGQRTLAHELTHVVQQRQGPVSGTDTGQGIALSNPADSFEQAAEDKADEFSSQSVQRADKEDEEEPTS